jgi:thioredoxin reductase
MEDDGDYRFDVIVVGGGPAGLSAALLLGRSRRRVLVCDAGQPRNARATGVGGFLGHDRVPPFELRAIAREQIGRYDVRFAEERVERISGRNGGFIAHLRSGRTAKARRVLLAPGLRDLLPSLPGLPERYGVSVFSCPFCDGWEHRDQRLGALGHGEDLEELGKALLGWSRRVTLFDTRGDSLSVNAREQFGLLGVDVVTEPVAGLEGEGKALGAVCLRDERRVPCDALFLKPECCVATELAAELGCKLSGAGEVAAEHLGRTCVAGVWVAGDASPATKMAIVAAAEGAQAATDIQCSLREEDVAIWLAEAAARR